MENLEELIAHIQGIEDLSEEEKNNYIKQLQEGKSYDEVIDDIQTKLQEKIDAIFDSEGITVDENDPEYQAKKKELDDEIAAAEAEFNQGMASLEEEASKFQGEVSKELDEAQLEDVRARLSAGE